MIRKCENCEKVYDDLYRRVICPHEAFACRHGKKGLCEQCDYEYLRMVKAK